MADSTDYTKPERPNILPISYDDVFISLKQGWHDLMSAPLISLSFGLFYACIGWLILFLAFKLDWGSYAYPLATGFALIAPMAAAGLYDISRRLEQAKPVKWNDVMLCLFGAPGQAIRIMAVITTFSYLLWLDIAAAIYIAFFGLKSITMEKFLPAIFHTPTGWAFLLTGNFVGACIAFAVFSIMVVSLPIIFDKRVDFVTAMITSVQTVKKNKMPMLLWCIIIAALLFASFATGFAGLILVFPLLGHTTWHLYRKVIA